MPAETKVTYRTFHAPGVERGLQDVVEGMERGGWVLSHLSHTTSGEWDGMVSVLMVHERLANDEKPYPATPATVIDIAERVHGNNSIRYIDPEFGT